MLDVYLCPRKKQLAAEILRPQSSEDWELNLETAKSEHLQSLYKRASPRTQPIQMVNIFQGLGLFLKTKSSAENNVDRATKITHGMLFISFEAQTTSLGQSIYSPTP